MRGALFAILLLAACLRFAGLGWGLRHGPDGDEQPFVDNAARMFAQRTLAHGFHEYPGLIFVLLAPAVALAGAPPAGPSAYLAARAVVAAFGVLSVALAFALARREGGRGAALLAAALLAVSPLEVFNAHEVKPDVVLGAFVLLAFFAFRRVAGERRFDLLSGVGIGAATAVKFSGALIAPAYVAYRLLAPGQRFRRIAEAAAVSLLSFFVLSPYTLLRPQAALGGMDDQLTYHYEDRGHPPDVFFDLLGVYSDALVTRGLGAVGIGLAVLGLALAGSHWRRRLPLAVFPVVALVVFSSAGVKHDRFLVPSLGVLAVLAGLGAESVARRAPRLGLALSLIAPILPLADSARYLGDILRPTTRDVVLDWVERHAAPGARILCSDAALGIDPARHEFVPTTGVAAADAQLARRADFAILGVPPGPGFERVLLAQPRGPYSGPPLAVYVAEPAARPRYRPIPLEAGWLSADENQEALALAVDGRRNTGWSTLTPQRPGHFVEVRLPEPRLLARIDLDLGNRPLRRGLDIDVWVLPPAGAEWQPARVAGARAADLRRFPPTNPPGEELLFVEPAMARAVRLTQGAHGERRWGFAELKLFALEN